MALINKPYTFTNGAGNAADGTQVNADFDTIYSLVNGNIEAVNMKDGIITLAKLASETKVIESVTHTPLTSNYTITGTEAVILSQSITLSAQRYCLFLLKYTIMGASAGYFIGHIYDGSTVVDVSESYIPSGQLITTSTIAYKQLTSGAHTIYFEGYGTANNTVYGDSNGTTTRLITIVFAF
jgi:hypothetical protein